MLGNEFPVGMCVENAPLVFPDVADAKFPIGDDAMVVAQEAMNFVGFQFLIKVSFLDHGSTSSSDIVSHPGQGKNTVFPIAKYRILLM